MLLQAGATAVIRALEVNSSLKTIGINSIGCEFGDLDINGFDSKKPDGKYTLNLGNPWERYIAKQLVAMGKGGERMHEVQYNGNPLDTKKVRIYFLLYILTQNPTTPL